MSKLLFTEDLKKALSELAVIDAELSKLTIKKDEIREKLQKWMSINSLSEYETFDSDEKNYFRLTITKTSRRNVNVDLLQAKIDFQIFNEVVSKTESSVFKCQIVKSKKGNSKKITAPSEI